MTLDLDPLQVESFQASVAGDPTQWLHAPHTDPDLTGCRDEKIVAPTYPYESCGCAEW